MADTTIKCACSHCGAKYRLPVEAQGRSARCKQCGEKFEVPRKQGLEDSILSWLTEPDAEEEAVAQPRVISAPTGEGGDPDAANRHRGPIRRKSGGSSTDSTPAS